MSANALFCRGTSNQRKAHKIWRQIWLSSTQLPLHLGDFPEDYLYIILEEVKTREEQHTIVVFWPSTRPKMPFRLMHRKEVTHSNGSYPIYPIYQPLRSGRIWHNVNFFKQSWLRSYERKSRGRKLAHEMGRGEKFPWYTHRLTHRKRVTSELHDSYFRLVTSGRWTII